MPTMYPTTVTAENIESVREDIPVIDQRDALEIGCTTWGICYSSRQRGQMTVWPDGRGAICYGGNSEWGDWDAAGRTLTTDAGDTYGENGGRIEMAA